MTTSLNLCHGKSVVFVMQLISWYHIHYWITSNSLVDSFLIGEVLNSHTKSKKPTMSYEPLRKTPTRCVQSCTCICTCIYMYMPACMDLTPVTTTAAIIFLSLFMCWCIIVMVIVIDVITVFKNDQMKWKQSLRDMKSLSYFVLFLRFSLKNIILGGKRFVSEMFPMVLFHKH